MEGAMHSYSRRLPALKRLRLDGNAGRETEGEAAMAEAKAVLLDLEALYGPMPEEFLWGTSMMHSLLQPTACFNEDSTREYRYIGREKCKALLEKMQGLEPPYSLQIDGAKGSGKSTAVCTLSGYMLAKKLRKVVYISAARFIAAPAVVLLHALLVATDCDRTLAHLTTVEEMTRWCSLHRRDRLLFVVDDWDRFEEFPARDAELKNVVAYYHSLVKLSSTNSRERRIYEASDKPAPQFSLDGPYTEDELKTWIAHSSLSEAQLQLLDCFTGGIPRLLRFYEEVKGKRKLFMRRTDASYSWKLNERFIAMQTTKEQLGSAVTMVTTGVRGVHLKGPVDLTCFYQDGNGRFRLLSPYLRSKAEYYIMEQNAALRSSLSYQHIMQWASAVRMDCLRGVKGRNPARAGWNVEGLVIAVMRYQGKLWKDALPFLHYKTFEHGGEAALLAGLSNQELCQGVLVGPVAFNENVLDVVYLKLDGDVLTIKAVQITISKWKNNPRKKSRRVWQEEVVPKWLAEGWKAEHQFVYVTPEKVELGTIQNDLVSYVDACHAQLQPTEEDAGDDDGDEDGDVHIGTEVYEGVNLDQVRNLGVSFKKLADVNECLEEFDRLLNLGKPEQVEKMEVQHCAGMVGTRPCKKWHRKDKNAENIWYCCPAHKDSSVHRSQV